MPIPDAIEKLGRAIFESPFRQGADGDALPEPAEIRLAVIDAVRAKSHRMGSVRVFSDDVIAVHLRGVPAERQASFENSLLSELLGKEVREALTRSGIRFPDDLAVEVRASHVLPCEGERFIEVHTRRLASGDEEAPAPVGDGWLSVTHGEANVTELAITKTRTNLGRTVDVFRTEGPSRRNDLAFLGESTVSRTVSREHAHILLDPKTRSYRIVNDRWARPGAVSPVDCGLWLVRDGMSLPVHRGRDGVVLRDGDEIHLGHAIVRFGLR